MFSVSCVRFGIEFKIYSFFVHKFSSLAVFHSSAQFCLVVVPILCMRVEHFFLTLALFLCFSICDLKLLLELYLDTLISIHIVLFGCVFLLFVHLIFPFFFEKPWCYVS